MEVSLFFEFIQVAVGNRKSLSVSVTDADWQRLFEFCKRQALIGGGFSAVEKLHAMGVVCPAALRMQWMAVALQIETRNALLNNQCSQLARRYEHDGLSTCILKGQGNCLNYPEGLRTRRMPGDIDVWTAPICDISVAVQTGSNDVEYATYKGFRAVREYVRMQHRIEGYFEKPVVRYHHIEAPKIDGTEVEVHFRPCYAHSPLRNWRMQRWFEEHADVCMKNKTHMGFAVPTASVNVVYQMCHLFSHYFDEGIGLRQLMDYYFALRVWHNDAMECKDLQTQGMWSEGLGTPVMSKEEVMAVIRSFGMGKFAGAVMWVLKEVFVGENEKCPRWDTDGCPQADYGMECESSEFKQILNGGPQADCVGERELPGIIRELKKNKFAPWMICEPNEKEGKKLLEEIMKGGNFGQYDTRDAALKRGGMVKHGLWKLKRVMRLVRSYPEEALWEPVFRVYHLVWRGING
ncbi:MAG: nucleotidyltransferase family protein [Prevotella sp.]|nr:nucleotidyltransferase family protein [Prevotella sp.]